MLVVLVIALAAGMLLTPAVRVLAWKLGAVSWPDGGRRLQHRPTALWGGIAVCLALFLSMGAAHWMGLITEDGLTLLVGAGLPVLMLCLLGCLDDRYNLPAKWKLLGQIVATVPVVFAGFCIDRLGGFGYELSLGWLGVPVTIGWLVLGINAMNLLDGMDGLASTVGIAVSLAIAAIAGSQGHVDIALMAVALTGALAGFVVHNRPPARIYLGDCGSMLLGFVVALLAMRVALVGPTSATATIAVILLLLPLLDTGLAVLRRVLKGRSFMAADRCHIHHRLLDQGFSVEQVLCLVGGFCVLTGTAAWQAAVSNDEISPIIAVGAIAVLAVNRKFAGYVEWALVSQLVGQAGNAANRWLSTTRLAAWLRIGGDVAADATGDNMTGDGVGPQVISMETHGLQFDGGPGQIHKADDIIEEEIRKAA